MITFEDIEQDLQELEMIAGMAKRDNVKIALEEKLLLLKNTLVYSSI